MRLPVLLICLGLCAGIHGEQNTGKTRMKENKWRPVFTDCSPAFLKENSALRTYVTQVKAVDSDSEGQIRYQMVGLENKLKFKVDEFNGTITSDFIFNRDEPERQKMAYVNVKATDNGSPPLQAICRFNVTILDVNDNAPIFDKVSYEASVPRDMAVNKFVMRIAADDVDLNENSRLTYGLVADDPSDQGFFEINNATGTITLVKSFSQLEGYEFDLRGTATDNGESAKSATVRVAITVASSLSKPPSFVEPVPTRVSINESYADVNELNRPIAQFSAVSNVADAEIEAFELLRGKSAMTNGDSTFNLEQQGNKAFLFRLHVNYEDVPTYFLTIRVKNKQGGAAETVLQVDVIDNNDEWPRFTDLEGGTVLENSPANTLVATVKATDPDGTFPNNQVLYRIVGDFGSQFRIDNNTGEIRTLVALDREQRAKYAVVVEAYDGAESFKSRGKPNSAQEKIVITVGDVNDNAPVFPQEQYKVDVAEDRDMGAKVSELKAVDPDSDSVLTYEIISGNVDDVFRIVTHNKSNTATLEVNRIGGLDYEKTKFYDLIVEVDDGQQTATTNVQVSIINVNDNRPEFLIQDKTISGINENSVPKDPIITIRARDPDYDPTVMTQPEKIKFSISTGLYSDAFTINQKGELFLIRPLDRDAPDGHKEWTVTVLAEDTLNGIELDNTLELSIMLQDVNDNAPFLDMVQPVVWNENQDRGVVAELKATDNDEEINGPPFTMRIAESADPVIRTSFQVVGSPATGWKLESKLRFDREQTKEFAIPIVVTDNGVEKMSATSTLTVVIGDGNDNAMSNGSSSILAYNFQNSLRDTRIGRVYVQDADDWDLPDKTFQFAGQESPYFQVTAFGGFITVNDQTPDGVYRLEFDVRDTHRNEKATGTVTVRIKSIPEEAVRRSGSLRLSGISQEQFLETPSNGQLSRKDRLRKKLTEIVGAIEDNIDVFTVFDVPTTNASSQLVDVRYSAHGSPYYDAVKLDGLTADHLPELEKLLDVKIVMFGVDECVYEKAGSCEGSCTNRMDISEQPYLVGTNTSSFVGVLATVQAECVCLSRQYYSADCRPDSSCLNGGTCTGHALRPCHCPDGFAGPRCEGLEVSFDGSGWAWYPALPTCSSGSLRFSLVSQLDHGVVVYAGPRALPPDTSISDYMAVELMAGSPVLYMDLGSGTQRLQLADASRSLVDGKLHDVEISWNERSLQMRIDQCPGGQSWCIASSTLIGDHQYLNVNGPLQIGGISADLEKLSSRLKWEYTPVGGGFAGCVQNVTFNDMVYNLHRPGHYKNATASCDGMTLPVTAGGFGIELIIILIVCLVILTILILSVLAYKKRNRHDNLKEFNDDIRENIINYSDEGGGEGDMTGYDLSVLRMTPDGKPLIGKNDDYGTLIKKDMEMAARKAATGTVGDVPDISQFLDDNKGRVDRDPDCLAYDDLRHYAYEGDGNSGRSLSSLISGSDDGDLDFDCLSEFGPRFKKLADIYGHHSSESEDDGGESWC